VDRLPEPRTLAQSAGTVTHLVLERLFDLPAWERTADGAAALVPLAVDDSVAKDPSIGGLLESPSAREEFCGRVVSLVRTDFELEDPRRLEPEARELWVEAQIGGPPPGDGGDTKRPGTYLATATGRTDTALADTDLARTNPSGTGSSDRTSSTSTDPTCPDAAATIALRGYVDRLDVAPGTGALRIVDYKTGKAPKPAYRSEALFQLRCYALALWRLRGQVPAMLQLLYLGNAEAIREVPSPADLERTEARLLALWTAIVRRARAEDWPAARGPLCPWCHFQPQCPAFGYPAPPAPTDTLARLGIA
jgi:putative RecB family exonuclease